MPCEYHDTFKGLGKIRAGQELLCKLTIETNAQQQDYSSK